MIVCIIKKAEIPRSNKKKHKQTVHLPYPENEFRILSQPHTLLFWRIVIFTKVYHYHNIVLLYSFAVAFLYIYGKKKNKQWPLPFFFVRKQTKKNSWHFSFFIHPAIRSKHSIHAYLPIDCVPLVILIFQVLVIHAWTAIFKRIQCSQPFSFLNC